MKLLLATLLIFIALEAQAQTHDNEGPNVYPVRKRSVGNITIRDTDTLFVRAQKQYKHIAKQTGFFRETVCVTTVTTVDTFSNTRKLLMSENFGTYHTRTKEADLNKVMLCRSVETGEIFYLRLEEAILSGEIERVGESVE